jgi:hypothetical protein
VFKKTNHNLDFTSIEFNYFYEKHDIKKQLTQSNTPYQNKVMECKNCSLVERVKKHVRKHVATPLWGKCEDETHTPKSGNLESSGTPATSEFNCRGQNTSL